MAKSEEAKDPAVPGKAKGKLKFIIIIVVALLLAIGASVGGTWFFLHKSMAKTDDKPAAAAVPAGKAPAIYEPMAPAFVVNLDQNGRQRYLQVSITLMTRDQAGLDALKVHMPVIRNNLVMLFSGQSFDALATPIGQEMLRQKATASVQEVAQKEVGKLVVEQLLFTNFVLQ